jgi:protein-disulfide isomerase
MTRSSFRAPGPVGRVAFLLLGAALAACGPRDEPGATPVVAAATPPAAGDTGRALLERADAARILGADSARVWLVEISDFQCPYCRRWHEETWPVIRREYVESGRVRFAYLNLPLPSHRHAREAAETALCAGLQGRYWQMHDAIFATQQRWSSLESATATFDSLAARTVPDARALRACVRDGRTRPLVEADYERAVSAGVRSTPTFIAGGRLIEGAAPPEYFRAALDSALAGAR